MSVSGAAYSHPMYQVIHREETNAEIDISASAADAKVISFEDDIEIQKIYARAGTEAVVGTADTKGVVSLDYTPTGSTRTEVAVFTFDGALAIGGTQDPDTAVTNFVVLAGEPIYLEHKTQAVAGAGDAAGKVYLGFRYRLYPSTS